MTRAVPVAVLIAMVAGTGCGGGDEGGSDSGRTRLVVSAASSMTSALESCAPRFGVEEDAEVKLSFAGSDELAAQIKQHAPVDVYAAANTKLPEQLHADGLLERPVEFATNELVLAVPKDSAIRSVHDLARKGTKLAVGSESVPIGSYTRETLAKLPPDEETAILGNVRSNEPDVNGILGKLTQGAADAGFVYATDVKAASGDLKGIGLSPDLEPRVTYAAGVVSKSRQPELGRRFVDGLTTGECASSLKRAGFGLAP